MSKPDGKPPMDPGVKNFLIALSVMLASVVIGSIVVMKIGDGTMRGAGIGHALPPERINPVAVAAPLSDDVSWTNDMVWIPGGTFWMGSENGQSDEKPLHEVEVDGFWVDKYELTNEKFEQFVKATGYVTIAERKPDAKDFPGVPPENLVPGSIVFTPPPGDDVPLDNHMLWWAYVPGASWRHPEGPNTSIDGKGKFPVVHIAWYDAVAYCKWANKRLPTEAEWEYASRGGLDRAEYSWGNEFKPGGKYMANIWEGRFPNQNTEEDGFRGTAPVGSFPPNGYGLHDMAGNVWEWVADWYTPDYYAKSPRKNPQGPLESESNDPNEPGMRKHVQRGGSFLCTDLYCGAYRPSRRMKTSPDTGLSHAGFRCVKDGPPPPGAPLKVTRPVAAETKATNETK